jgi:hypothetical protein
MKSANFGLQRFGIALVVTVIALGVTVLGAAIGSAQVADPVSVAEIKPIPMPDPMIPGYRFPEDEATIIGWNKANNQKDINLHGWGIWTALTLPSGEKFNGQELGVFETWLSPKDLVSAHLTGVTDLLKLKRAPRLPTVPRQFQRGKFRAMPLASGSVNQPLVTVKYDPTTAAHIQTNRLLQAETLTALIKAGKTDVPAFPVRSVSLKPTYITASRSKLVDGRYFRLEAWPGTPATPQAFGPEEWKQWVWVDVKDLGEGSGKGKVDTVGTPNSRTAETTYGLGRFIYHQLSATEALVANAAIAGPKAPVTVAGDYQLLVGMHVTSREITRWTWQTFWWTPDADNAPAPSSKEIVKNRPAQLIGAPRNYAMSIGYDMLDPATPVNGGGNNGVPIYVFNPWLEAGFGPNVLPNSKQWTFGGKTYDNKFGMQTNCMSCHAQANFGTGANPPDYTADQYVDLAGPQFRGFVKVDFLWSIPDNAQ